MSAADALRWQARWLERTGPVGAPEPFLVRALQRLPPGPVLDIAAGDGRNALWLAAQGRQVTAVDIAPAAIARLRAQAGGRAVATRLADLDAPGALAGLGGFAALVAIRYRPPAGQWPALLATLAPGGCLLLCSFAVAQHVRHGMPCAFCLDGAALAAELAPSLRLLDWQEWEAGDASLAGSLWSLKQAEGR